MTFLRNQDLEMLSPGEREWCLNRKQVLFAVMYVVDFVIYMILLMSAARLFVRAYDIIVHSQNNYRLITFGCFICFVIFVAISENYLYNSPVRKENSEYDKYNKDDSDREHLYSQFNSSPRVRTRRYRSCSPIRTRR